MSDALAPDDLRGVVRVKGPTIRLRSGAYFDFEDPSAGDWGIGDVAHALSQLCRFTGHTVRFYSVAEHSWWCSRLVPREDALAALLHDAPEAFLGDVSRPLKSMLPDYRAIEARVEVAVLGAFGLPPRLPPSVKLADVMMLAAEQRQAMLCEDDWGLGVEPAPVTLNFWHPALAKDLFLKRFEELAA